MIRGITLKTMKKLQIIPRQDKIIFPIFNVYRQHVGNIQQIKQGSIKYHKDFFPQYPNETYIFGEWQLPNLFYGKPVIIVEGIYDALSLYQAGIPALSINNNEMNYTKLAKVLRYTHRLIFWFDSDNHGENGLARTLARLKEFPDVIYRVIECNEEKDPNDLLVKKPKIFEEKVKEINNLMKEMT